MKKINFNKIESAAYKNLYIKKPPNIIDTKITNKSSVEMDDQIISYLPKGTQKWFGGTTMAKDVNKKTITNPTIYVSDACPTKYLAIVFTPQAAFDLVRKYSIANIEKTYKICKYYASYFIVEI